MDLAVELWPWSALAEAAWNLRGSVTAYDGAYAALASRLDVPLVTLDRKLQRTANRHCQVLVPPAR
ncbi:MAG: type II toxin-antitoxin system VapC family toxin [Actinomycetota bacterium]|nr:type II toxin-antitoxin system VapC family toxin [Actinomycetota bacterium]